MVSDVYSFAVGVESTKLETIEMPFVLSDVIVFFSILVLCPWTFKDFTMLSI